MKKSYSFDRQRDIWDRYRSLIVIPRVALPPIFCSSLVCAAAPIAYVCFPQLDALLAQSNNADSSLLPNQIQAMITLSAPTKTYGYIRLMMVSLMVVQTLVETCETHACMHAHIETSGTECIASDQQQYPDKWQFTPDIKPNPILWSAAVHNTYASKELRNHAQLSTTPCQTHDSYTDKWLIFGMLLQLYFMDTWFWCLKTYSVSTFWLSAYPTESRCPCNYIILAELSMLFTRTDRESNQSDSDENCPWYSLVKSSGGERFTRDNILVWGMRDCMRSVYWAIKLYADCEIALNERYTVGHPSHALPKAKCDRAAYQR